MPFGTAFVIVIVSTRAVVPKAQRGVALRRSRHNSGHGVVEVVIGIIFPKEEIVRRLSALRIPLER